MKAAAMPRKEPDRPFPAHKPSSIPTRTSLVDGLKALSSERWDEFVYDYSPLIRYWIGHSEVSKSDIDDISQECLTSLYKSIGRFKRLPTKRFCGWIRIIVNRRVYDYQRKNNKRKKVLLRDSLDTCDGNWDKHNRSNDYLAALRQTKARVYERIKDAVAQKTFEMYWQYCCEDRDAAEVARSFGISQAGVRMAKKRVLEALESRGFTREELVD
jgi:RNA polymerase sigma factor (sigma-70 family)